MSRYTGGEAICQALLDCGVTHLFGLPGTQNVPLFESLRTSQLKVIVPTHELSAGFMANGYYRATGKLPVVLTIPGPGFTYVTTALAEAKHDSAAMVYITVTPESIPGKNFCLQELPQSGMVRPLVKEVLKIQSAEQIHPKIHEAVHLAMGGEPGPVYVEIESSVIRGEARRPEHYRPTADAITGDLDAAAAFLKTGSRIVVFTGAGAFGAVGEIEQILSLTRAPLVTTCSGRGILPEDDPRNVTIDLSTGGVGQLNQLFEQADRILVVGAKLGHNGSGGFRLVIPREKLVRVDASEEVVGSNYPTDYPLVGDAREVLRELCSRLTGYTPGWIDERTGPGPEMPDIVPATRDGNGSEVGIDIFISQLRAAFPRSAVCLTDSGWHQMLTRRFYKVLAPRGLIVPADFQSMGFGIPAAIGAAVADPARRVLCVVGDGGLLMAGMELVTAVRLHLNITFIVFRDGHYGLIRLQQARGYGESFGTELPNIDYHALCDSLGVGYYYGPSIGENELKSIAEGRGASLIECPIFDRPSFEKLVRKTRFKRSLRRMVALSGFSKLRKLFGKGPV